MACCTVKAQGRPQHYICVSLRGDNSHFQQTTTDDVFRYTTCRHGCSTPWRRRCVPRGHRQFPRNVRLHGLWLLCHRHRSCVLPCAQRILLADAVAGDVRRRLPDAPNRWLGVGQLHRSAWTPQGSDPDPEPDVRGRVVDRLCAGLRQHRHTRTGAGIARSPATGLFRWRGTGRRVGVSGRDRHAGPTRFLCGLAIGQPAGRGGVCRGARRRPAYAAIRERDGQLGMAHPVLHRQPDLAVDFPDPPFAARNAGVRRAPSARPGWHRPVAARQCRVGAGWRRAGADDYRVVLSDHRLHADLMVARSCT